MKRKCKEALNKNRKQTTLFLVKLKLDCCWLNHTAQDTMYKVGDTITYTAFDEESYSRGYGCRFETKTGKITEIRYKMENFDDINESYLLGEKPESIKEGDTLTYEIWDGEEGRTYGWFKATKKAKVSKILYQTDKYDKVSASDIQIG
jgi:hypothetical protein